MLPSPAHSCLHPLLYMFSSLCHFPLFTRGEGEYTSFKSVHEILDCKSLGPEA